MVSWRIYYRDGSTYSDEEGPPESALKCHVQGIVFPDGIIERRDFYWWDDGAWWGGDLYGRIQYELEPGWKLVLLGQSDHDDRYEATRKRMIADRWAMLGQKGK